MEQTNYVTAEDVSSLPKRRKEAKIKGISHYFTGKPCRQGHVDKRFTSTGQCFRCVYLSTAKQAEGRREKRQQEVLAMEIVCSQCKKTFTPDFGRGKRSHTAKYCSQPCRDAAERDSKLRWLEANPELRKEVANAYARKVIEEKGEQWKKVRKRNAEYIKDRLNSDDDYRLTHNLRTRLNRALKQYKASKRTSVTKLIGCSIEELRAHLENQFVDGMTWENWTRDGWHIDHIKPIASFDRPDDPDCWHYTNLQPLWASENMSKGSKAPQ